MEQSRTICFQRPLWNFTRRAGLDLLEATMRALFAAALIASNVSCAMAQTSVQAIPQPNKPGDSEHSTGRSVIPNEKGQLQPQGWTGPIDTKVGGGAPASSPQGQTPPGMQSAPDGSDKVIVSPPK